MRTNVSVFPKAKYIWTVDSWQVASHFSKNTKGNRYLFFYFLNMLGFFLALSCYFIQPQSLTAVYQTVCSGGIHIGAFK